MHSFKNISLLFFLCLFQFVNSQVAKKQYILSSGSMGGNYNKTGALITRVLDSIYPQFQFINIESSGSLENIQQLDNRFADFAIVQRDVLLENIYDEVNGIKNVEIILPLFEEKLLVYTKKSLAIDNSLVQSCKKFKKIGFTSKTGYSFKIFEKICRLLNVNLNDIEIVEGTYPVLSQFLIDGSIDALVTFSLPIQKINTDKTIGLVSLSNSEIQLIISKINNVSPIKIEAGDQKKTIGSWTFFVGLDKSIGDIHESTKKTISQSLFEAAKNDKSVIAESIKESVIYFQNKENHGFIYGIPMSTSTGNLMNYTSWDIARIIFLFSLLLIGGIALYIARKQLVNIDMYIVWIRYKHIILGIFFICILYYISVEVLLIAESSFYKKLGIKSKVLNLTKTDVHFWIIITNLTGNNNNIFPLSYVGQLMLSFSSYILIVGSIIIGFCEYLIYKFNKKRKQGLMQFNTKNHIIVIGWKSTTSKFLEELINAKNSYKKKLGKIITIVENPLQIIEDYPEIKKLQEKRYVEFVAGDATDEVVLKNANIENANTVVILSENTTKEADQKTLLRSLAISRYCRKKMLEKTNSLEKVTSEYKKHEVDKYIDSIYIIAELNDQKYTEDLKKSDVNEIINSSVYSKNIITQSLLNHGVSKVLDEVLNYNEFNEFYTIDLKLQKFKSLVRKTYDQLIPVLRDKGILLIGVRVVYHNTNDQEIIDEETLKQLLEKEGLSRQIIVNPTDPTEKERRTDDDDQLIVFCTGAGVLEKAFVSI
ncbi:TAXI family TRAP transporter solute-binding subunit [uncultured Dokdonia sp.]|uniref:TrkA-related ion transporter n=1 Tax=uncultured Dokdonia sp. TaxID=575653 RepID=UPI002613615F|nr:TAXI family TRAP transporter solute-binding subunit [uncultured Dokdonia sp.]